jgi:hypothetical protein
VTGSRVRCRSYNSPAVGVRSKAKERIAAAVKVREPGTGAQAGVVGARKGEAERVDADANIVVARRDA